METQRPDHEDRGQTAIDFVAGMGVLMLAMIFVFLFVPSMFAPFFGGGIGDPVTADRAASHLVEDRLAKADAPNGVLSPAANESFFDSCEGEGWLQDELGIDQRSVRVEVGNGSCGPTPQDSVTVSKRFVVENGTEKMVYVKVW